MTEPTIAYTLFALLLASSACLLIGTVIGWYAQSYQNRGLLEETEAKLRNNQQEMAALQIQREQESKDNSGETVKKLSGINDQKTALIKKLMEKQLVLQKQRQQQAKQNQTLLTRLKRQIKATQTWRQKANGITEADNSEDNKQLATRHVEAEAAQALKANDTKPKTDETVTPNADTLSNAIDLTPAKVAKADTVKNNTATADVVQADEAQSSATAVTEKVTPEKSKPVSIKKNESPATKVSKVKDDLTRIKGIGPKIEEALNEVGIMNVGQLADLTPIRVNELDKQLGRYGRISRLNWVGAAKKLAAKQKKELAAA